MELSRLGRLGRIVAATSMAASLLLGSFAVASPVAGFTGHGCTKATCQFFTSSYYTTVYYYNRKTCSAWKNLSTQYLQGFKTSAALLARYPNRKLHKPC